MYLSVLKYKYQSTWPQPCLQQPQKRNAWSVPYLEGLLHCLIQIEHGLRSTVDAFRLQEVVKLLYM